MGVEGSKKTANHRSGGEVLVFVCRFLDDPGLKVFGDPSDDELS